MSYNEDFRRLEESQFMNLNLDQVDLDEENQDQLVALVKDQLASSVDAASYQDQHVQAFIARSYIRDEYFASKSIIDSDSSWHDDAQDSIVVLVAVQVPVDDASKFVASSRVQIQDKHNAANAERRAELERRRAAIEAELASL